MSNRASFGGLVLKPGNREFVVYSSKLNLKLNLNVNLYEGHNSDDISKYVKKLTKGLISPLMQVKPFVYIFLGNDVIVKIHPHYIWMTKPCPGWKA